MLHPEPAAEVDDGRRPVEFRAALDRERREPVDARPRGSRLEELRAEVDVDPGDVQPRFTRARDGVERDLGREPELGAMVRRPDRRVRVGFDPGRDANEDAPHAGRRGPLRLVLRVEHHEPCAHGDGGCELLVALVVAVHHDPLARDLGPFGKEQLAEGRDVGSEAFRAEEAEHRETRKGLDAVGDERVRRRLSIRVRLREDRLPAVDDERSPMLRGELGRAQAADRELAAGLAGGVREELEHGHEPICTTPWFRPRNPLTSGRVKGARPHTGTVSIFGLFPIARPHTG